MNHIIKFEALCNTFVQYSFDDQAGHGFSYPYPRVRGVARGGPLGASKTHTKKIS